jgi:Ca2+-binding RTX toxin-like protein
VTSLTLGPIAAQAFDGVAANGFAIAINGTLVKSGSVSIDARTIPLDVILTMGATNDRVAILGNNITANGGAGNDSYALVNGSPTVIDAAGIDTITSTKDRSLMSFAAIENLTLVGSAAIDGTGNGRGNTITGNGAVNVLRGGLGNDSLNGGAGNDVLDGAAGNDLLDGGVGNDRLNGGAGNDTFVINSARDVLTDAAGIDLVRSTFSKTLATRFENLTLVGTASVNGTGNAAANIITGNTGNNKLFGLAGNDTLSGGARNDILTGGTGKDTMTGGAGADDFDFNSVAEIGRGASRDVIKDFAHLVDDIDLATIDANGSARGHAFSFLTTKGAAFTGTAGELRWFQQNLAGSANDRTIVEGDINGNRVADFQIQLTGLKTLTAGDFIL